MIKNMMLGIAVAMSLSTFATTPVLAQSEPVKVCTASKGGNYEYVGLKLQEALRGQTDIEVVNTAGSWDNLERMARGECDAAVVQSDALYVYGKEAGNLDYFNLGALYTEYVHLLCNRKSGVEEWADLNKNTKVFSGGRGSGADVTARGLIQADAEFGNKSYVGVPLLNEQNPDVSLMKVKGGAAECLVYVGSKGNKFMGTNAQKLANDLVLRPVEDKDFNDVTLTDDNGVTMSVWTPVEMPYSTYEKLMPTGVFGRKDVPTIGVTAMLIVSSNLVEQNPDAYAAIGFGIEDAVKVVRADKKVELVQ